MSSPLAGCLWETYSCHPLVIAEVCLLITTAVNRCLATCNPFYHLTIKIPHLYTEMTEGVCFCGFFTPFPKTAWISTLSFYDLNQILSIFCHFDPTLILTCMAPGCGHCTWYGDDHSYKAGGCGSMQ